MTLQKRTLSYIEKEMIMNPCTSTVSTVLVLEALGTEKLRCKIYCYKILNKIIKK